MRYDNTAKTTSQCHLYDGVGVLSVWVQRLASYAWCDRDRVVLPVWYGDLYDRGISGLAILL